MGKSYVMVRLTSETHTALSALRQSWAEAYEAGRPCPELPFADGLPSLSDCVAELIRRDYDHRERSRRSAVTAAKRAVGIDPAPAPSEGQVDL